MARCRGPGHRSRRRGCSSRPPGRPRRPGRAPGCRSAAAGRAAASMPNWSAAVWLHHSMRPCASSSTTPLGEAWMAARNSCSRRCGLCASAARARAAPADALDSFAPDAAPRERQRRAASRAQPRAAAACARQAIEQQPAARRPARRRRQRRRASQPASRPARRPAGTARKLTIAPGHAGSIIALGRSRQQAAGAIGCSDGGLGREPVAGAAHRLDHRRRPRPATRAGASRARRPCAPR